MAFRVSMALIYTVATVLMLLMMGWSYSVRSFDLGCVLAALFAIAFACNAALWYMKVFRLARFKKSLNNIGQS